MAKLRGVEGSGDSCPRARSGIVKVPPIRIAPACWLTCLCLLAAPAAAEPAVAPSRAELVDELRGISQALRSAWTRLDGDLAVSGGRAVEILNRAQVAFFEEDYPRAAIDLLQLVARPGIERHAVYAEALAYLGESLWALGMEKAAAQYLRQALEQPKVLPSGYRRMLARYLALAGDTAPLDEARGFWRRYQGLRDAADEPTALDHEVRYQYAKALFRGGALGEAESLFAAIDQEDPRHLEARYFAGVIHLSRDDLVKAQEAFDETLEAYERRRRPASEAAALYLDRVAPKGPAREVVNLELPDEEILPDEETRRLERLGAVIHLALARLAAARDDDTRAWRHYRRVARGDPDFVAALSEATFVLFRRGHYRWCVNLIDQLLAGRGDDVSAAQLSLWKSQLLARDAAYDEARASYQTLDTALKRRAEELEAELVRDQRLFPQAVLAWSAPEDATRAADLEAELVTQEEALIEIRELLDALRALQQRGGPLPAVERGRAVEEKLRARLDAFAGRHREAAEALARGETASAIGEPLADATQLEELARSQARMRARLEKFGEQLGRLDQAWRTRIDEVVRAETPAVEALARALDGERGSAAQLATAMRTTARHNLDDYAAEALFGQVDIAWWRKEEITRKIREAHEARAEQLTPLEASKRAIDRERATLPADPRYDLRDEPLPAPVEEEEPAEEPAAPQAPTPARPAPPPPPEPPEESPPVAEAADEK